jgi:hypothetical protein
MEKLEIAPIANGLIDCIEKNKVEYVEVSVMCSFGKNQNVIKVFVFSDNGNSELTITIRDSMTLIEVLRITNAIKSYIRGSISFYELSNAYKSILNQ